MTTLSPEHLRTICDPTAFEFETTAELDELDHVVGQERAMDAIRFGIGMAGPGFNIFAMGPSGIGKHHVIHVFLNEIAPMEATPPGWLYVHNFDEPRSPRAIAMKPGGALVAREAVDALLEKVEVAIGAALEGDNFRQRVQRLHASFDAQHDDALQAVALAADSKSLALEQTQNGFAIIPLMNGEPATPEQVFALSEEEQHKIEANRQHVESLLRRAVDKFAAWDGERRVALQELQQNVVDDAVQPLFDRVRDDFSDCDRFVAHLHAMEAALVRDPSPFFPEPQEGESAMLPGLGFEQFGVNVLVDCIAEQGAPVVYEDDPTYENLHGRVEYDATMGGLTTNFTLIREGSLHRANGGYLVVDARKLLADPHSWSELKRTLYAQQVKVVSRSESALAPRALSLDPEPVPLDVKVLMVGERETYYALRELDPDMDELFKVMADFDTHIDRTPDAVQTYAKFVATIARTEALRPFAREAVARIVDEGARLAQHAERLSTHMRPVADLLRSADYWADADDAAAVTAAHVDQALREERRRNGRLRDLMLEEVTNRLINVETDGEAVGEVNGLSVLQFGASSFGRPTRISAAVSPGRQLIDIEREVDLGGPIHSKGVMLLAGFLAHRYGSKKPLAVSATIAFEQSYGPVDGDSASAAETAALLSALAEVPIKQSFAMTGAIDQRGRVQAVGGVDAKIEGFFELCAERGLTGTQGVLIPAANVSSLMLRQPVIDAVKAGKFSVHAVASIDEAMELLTGLDTAQIDEKVRKRLTEFAGAWSQFSKGD